MSKARAKDFLEVKSAIFSYFQIIMYYTSLNTLEFCAYYDVCYTFMQAVSYLQLNVLTIIKIATRITNANLFREIQSGGVFFVLFTFVLCVSEPQLTLIFNIIKVTVVTYYIYFGIICIHKYT